MDFESQIFQAQQGLQKFVNSIVLKNPRNIYALNSLLSKPVDIVWYPGCGNDLSPCTVLDDLYFEEKIRIDAYEQKLYIFVDPDQYGLCQKSFGYGNISYFTDISSDTYSEKLAKRYKIIAREKIVFKSETMNEEISGYYMILKLGYKKCQIIYLNMNMQDFLLQVIKPYSMDIKWLFYLNMENSGGRLFDLFNMHSIPFPKFICANRIKKFGIEKFTKYLKSVDLNTGIHFKNDFRSPYMYGPMLDSYD